MKTKKQEQQATPPKWAESFFASFCKPELFEALSGDLEEEFKERVSSEGICSARWKYIFQVLSFMRPFVIKSFPLYHIIPIIMFQHFFKLALRSRYIRHKINSR